MAVPLFNLAPDMPVSRLCLGFQLNTLYSLPFLNACISLCEADFRLFGLGTMTFGEQNSLPQSFQLLDKAFDSGINFFDSAEMISLLAYSPLAMGILSGKYLSLAGGPADGRLNLFKGRYAEGESRYNLSNVIIRKATERPGEIHRALLICFI
ncbi:hypothetical protein Sango_0382600 [Sesamum angolense]|uniref:NADP-dependent oxidoreductase domain-containing protein n=1 Tax=Sesamum angolense TaxID=2727404 RepID=A0AAE1XAJ4_9LAMI|nr:hypothetical protein Sango_0382600 [Sesamum angolense]